MASKQEHMYPQTEMLPNVPPSYNQATAPAPQAMPLPQTVHVVQQVPVGTIPLGPQPTRVTCPSCHQVQVSRTEYVSSTKTHIIAVILCIFTGCCCCIPYCVDSCKSVEHTCSNCGAYLGKYDN